MYTNSDTDMPVIKKWVGKNINAKKHKDKTSKGSFDCTIHIFKFRCTENFTIMENTGKL